MLGMEEGCKNLGIKYDVHKSYVQTDADVAIFYGMRPDHIRVLEEFKASGRKVLVTDLAYFGYRKLGTSHDHLKNYFKVAINAMHPTAYFHKINHSSDRWRSFKIKVQPLKLDGKYILLAGIGPKSSLVYKIKHQSWDEKAISILRKHTKMPIYYRAKPNHAEKFKKLDGTVWTSPKTPINELIDKSFAIVTRHSNVAIDGLVRGKPCFVQEGPASVISHTDLSLIKTPKIVSYDEQMQFFYNLAYTQFSIDEIKSGMCIKHFIDEGLI